MKKKVTIILLCATMMLALSSLRNGIVSNFLFYNVEALADGGEWGTPDFYLSKARARLFTDSVKECKRLGLTESEINNIKRWNYDLQGYECVFYCCWDAEYESDSCHPYSDNVNRYGLCYPKHGNIGLWDYKRECRSDAFD